MRWLDQGGTNGKSYQVGVIMKYSREGAIEVSMALVVLVAGSAVYLIVRRDIPQVFLIASRFLCCINGVVELPGARFVPSLAHTYAFSLLTIVSLSARGYNAYRVCLYWATVELLFEFGQLRAVGTLLVNWLPPFIVHQTWASVVIMYFANGRFDILDVLAILAGASAAWTTAIIVECCVASRMSRSFDQAASDVRAPVNEEEMAPECAVRPVTRREFVRSGC